MASSLDTAKQHIDSILNGYQLAAGLPPQSMLGASATAGKVYEAWVLCRVLERMHQDEGYAVTLHGSNKVTLKSSPGPINSSYPHFELDDGATRFEVWTDVEFLALSHDLRGAPTPSAGDYHELDILIVSNGTTGRPQHDEVVLGVECKHTRYRKELLRGILGVRRELSFLRQPQPTPFANWPRADVPASPPSCLLVYCSSPAVLQYEDPGETFGIDFCFEPLP